VREAWVERRGCVVGGCTRSHRGARCSKPTKQHGDMSCSTHGVRLGWFHIPVHVMSEVHEPAMPALPVERATGGAHN
jgi:hypothetical protein